MWRYIVTWPISILLLQWFRFGMWMHRRSTHEDPLKTDRVFQIVAYPFILVDVIYNYTIGAFVMWEWHCCDVVFTTRLQRLADTEPKHTMRYRLVVIMAKQLNQYDPNHVVL